MIHELLPTELYPSANAFRQELTQLVSQKVSHCPFCQHAQYYTVRARESYSYQCKACYKYFTALTRTPFQRLIPINWLDTIFTSRIKRESYSNIAEKLDCSVQKVMRRDKVMMSYLKTHYMPLYQWYQRHNEDQLLPNLAQQHRQVKEKITALLSDQKRSCVYCHSTDTVRIGERTCYRCKRCRHTFNLLANRPLKRLPRTNLWLPFVDLLVAGNNNTQIKIALKLSGNTVSKWRGAWCSMMQNWNSEALAIWCMHGN